MVSPYQPLVLIQLLGCEMLRSLGNLNIGLTANRTSELNTTSFTKNLILVYESFHCNNFYFIKCKTSYSYIVCNTNASLYLNYETDLFRVLEQAWILRYLKLSSITLKRRIYLVVEVVKHPNPEEICDELDKTYFGNCIIEAMLQQYRPFQNYGRW